MTTYQQPISGTRAAASTTQEGYAFRFDWGVEGLCALAPVADVVVVVDVLRFTSAVSAAIEAGATVLPFPWQHDDAAAYAAQRDAVLGGSREDGGLSLSPTDLLSVAPGTRVVLPSPNGSALAYVAPSAGADVVLAGCLRNAGATARLARDVAGKDGVIAVIGAGERWHDAEGPLRPAVEDLLGAGAILAALDPSGSVSTPGCSPEAAAARAAYRTARPRLFEELAACASGRELIVCGWRDDVATSAALDTTQLAAQLIDGEFVPRPPE